MSSTVCWTAGLKTLQMQVIFFYIYNLSITKEKKSHANSVLLWIWETSYTRYYNSIIWWSLLIDCKMPDGNMREAASLCFWKPGLGFSSGQQRNDPKFFYCTISAFSGRNQSHLQQDNQLSAPQHPLVSVWQSDARVSELVLFALWQGDTNTHSDWRASSGVCTASASRVLHYCSLTANWFGATETSSPGSARGMHLLFSFPLPS